MIAPKQKHNGFSLIETVIVLLLTGLLLGSVASLAGRTIETLSFLKEKGETLQSATLICERMASEMQEMIQAPTGLGTGTFSFVKVNANAPYVMNLDFDDPVASPPHLWTRDYVATGDDVTVAYTETLPQVFRSVDGGPATLVAGKVNTFRVDNSGTLGTYDITLAILEKKRLFSFVARVNCPGVPRP